MAFLTKEPFNSSSDSPLFSSSTSQFCFVLTFLSGSSKQVPHSGWDLLFHGISTVEGSWCLLFQPLVHTFLTVGSWTVSR